MSIHRKFTLQEIHSWPDVPVKEELNVLNGLLKKLEDEESYELAAVVHNRMETLRGNNNLQNTYQ